MTRRLLFALVPILMGTAVAVPVSAQPPTIENARSLHDIVHAVDYLPGAHGDILRLYRAFFDREPDLVGAKYWLDVNESGHTLDDIAEYFTGSVEFANNYTGTGDEEYLRRVYTNVLGRTYDESGFAYWLDLLQGTNLAGFNETGASISRGAVVRWVSAGDEFEARYPYLPDPPDPGVPRTLATHLVTPSCPPTPTKSRSLRRTRW